MHTTERVSNAREAETAYTKGTKAELAGNYDSAFQYYVRSAELYLHLSRVGNLTEIEKKKWQKNSARAMERAEKIKSFVERAKSSSASSPQPEANSSAGLSLTPVGVNRFSRYEQLHVLKKGGLVNGLTISPWDEVVSLPLVFRTPYEDPDGQPKLSSEQIQNHAIWRRAIASSNVDVNVSSSRGIRPEQIVQHVVTDCSVCTSVSVCVEHNRRFGSKLAELCIYQLIHRAGPSSSVFTPTPSSAIGGYDIRLFFNGTWRRVVIDDLLPYNAADESPMCMTAISLDPDMPAPIWPSILEKAYMKLMGGYDFPGSNSCIDIHAFTGWIPEHAEIRSPSFEREKMWSRITKGFTSGSCMLTVGTGKYSCTWRNNDLLASHSYAVIDVSESSFAREITVLDPWVDPHSPEQARKPSRLMQIPWNDVLDVFDSIYLSWDPAMWAQSITFHGVWKCSENNGEAVSEEVRIKYENRSETEQDVWILLTRHVANSGQTSDFISLKIEYEDDFLGHCNVADQTKISAKGNFTNSTHVLVKMRISQTQESGTLSILASYDGPASETGFTLTAYPSTNLSISWDEHVPHPPFTKTIEGALTTKNAGGNCTYPTFMLNPQYHLRIHPPRDYKAGSRSALNVSIRTRREIPISIALIWSQGGRVHELVEQDLAASSGPYNYGQTSLIKEILPGDYTLVVSAFEPRYTGPFSLKIDSSLDFNITPITQEGAGMYMKIVRGSWVAQSAAGSPATTDYSKNPVFELHVTSTTKLMIRLQLVPPASPTSLNVTIFPRTDDGSLARHITTSGPYSDANSGVVTPMVHINSGRYWIVPSTYNSGIEATFQLVIYSTINNISVIETGNSASYGVS